MSTVPTPPDSTAAEPLVSLINRGTNTYVLPGNITITPGNVVPVPQSVANFASDITEHGVNVLQMVPTADPKAAAIAAANQKNLEDQLAAAQATIAAQQKLLDSVTAPAPAAAPAGP